MPRLCGFYPGICLTTEEEARKNRSQGSQTVRTNLEQMFKRTATVVDTQSTTTQQRRTCAFKNVRLLPDGCCCLSDKGNEILFSINIPPSLNNDRWFGRDGPLAWPPRSPALTPIGFFLWGHIRALIHTSPFNSESILLPVLLRQHPGTVECSCQSLLRCYGLYIEVGGHKFVHLL